MDAQTLTVVKGVLYSIIMGIPVLVGLVEDGNPDIIVVAYIFAVLLVFGVEIQQIKIGDWLYIKFNQGFRNSESGDNKKNGNE